MKSGPPSFLLSILQRRFDAFDELEHSFKALKLDAICAIISTYILYLYRQGQSVFHKSNVIFVACLLEAMMTGFGVTYHRIQKT